METGGHDQASRFAFNCGIATPLRRHGRAVYAVDLFTDVLVRSDGVAYRAIDLEDFEHARRDGLILPGEARGAARGLAELTCIIDRGDLPALLSRTCPIGPLDPPAASPPIRVPLARVPLSAPKAGPPGFGAKARGPSPDPTSPPAPRARTFPNSTAENQYGDRRPQGDDGAVSEGVAVGGSADPGLVTMLYLCMEVAGCPTVCRHCWAQGTGYGVMPLADIEWVLEEAHRFCDGRGVAFDAYPMHELAAHPDAARLFGLFNSHSGTVKRDGEAVGGTMFEPWPTTGVPLALREDWRSVLQAAAGTGTLNLWVAFHGAGEVHDRQVNHRGAYTATCLAVERAHAAGLSVGCNVFLTTDSLPQLDELIGTVGRLVDTGTCFEVASYLPTPRSRRNERLRLPLPELAPVAARLAELADPVNVSQWTGLETRTEAAYVRQALAGDWPAIPDPAPGELALVCRPNLDVYSGLAGLYRVRHGNLRTDGIAAVLGSALAHGRQRDDELWFGPGPLPAPGELASRYGDAAGLGVHPGPESVRYLWLDRAKRHPR